MNNINNLSELCLVKFQSNANAQIHFDGVQHRNKVIITQNHNPATPWCEICCCELNTTNILEIHKKSPKHLKKQLALEEIMDLKERYMKSKLSTNQSNDIDPVDNKD